MNKSIYIAREKFIEHLRKRNLSDATILRFDTFFHHLFPFLEENAVRDVTDIKTEHVEKFILSLKNHRKKNGKPFSDSYRRTEASFLRLWLSFLETNDMIFINPARNIPLEQVERPFPKDILSVEEMKLLLQQPNIKHPVGLRNRAILEIFYGSGIRSAELCSLKLKDVDLDGSYLFIKGKGSKDRVVPITKQAKRFLKLYLDKVRPLYCNNTANENVFFTVGRDSLVPGTFRAALHNYVLKSGIKKKVSTHTLRHTCATHLIANGASIRYVQELLGHAYLSTTQIYSRVMPVDLRKVYEKTHPRCTGMLIDDGGECLENN